jgi:alkanesulfonate monooxygenase SsuD/methylene tetrahydromethanopterin reductase-like flavin-dependent oxidoreductase (luciferase family)
MNTPLSVLDLSPVPAGGTTTDALHNTIDLARAAEAAGYHRYWLAEHHLAPGVASSAPTVLIALVAAATERIRVGSGAVQLGHRTALSTVEEFGTVAALHPDRIDLGIGRSAQRRATVAGLAGGGAGPSAAEQHPPDLARAVGGLLIPPRFSAAGLLASPRLAAQAALLGQPGAQPPDFADQLDTLLALIEGRYRTADGIDLHAHPGENADVQLWILGSSGGESAQLAGARGLPFAANYHVSPATVLEAVDAYRAAFRPSTTLAKPYVLVSADAVVGPDDRTARRLAAGYGLWVHSIRSGQGAIPFPTPEQAAAHQWTDQQRALVTDRTETQFVGAPDTVAGQLRVLQKATGADELLVTTITHEHADRIRSYQLLAEAWSRQDEG